MKSALVTLGSNINQEINISKAIHALNSRVGIALKAISPFYRTKAILDPSNPPQVAQPLSQKESIFYNAAVLIETTLLPLVLRGVLRAIESAQGRIRTADKFAPRPIDLDIALYDQEIHHTDQLHIPDPDILRHPHVAIPLADIAPDWVYPGDNRTLRQIAESLFYTEEEIKRV